MGKADGYIKISVDIGKTALQKKLLAIMSDRHSKEEVHKELGEFCEPFVPKKSGELRKSMHATATGVSWSTPYAHYQYEGEVYGPNLPIIARGDPTNRIWGWYSRKPKHPTGRELGVPGVWRGWKFGYSEPGTAHHWFDVAVRSRGMRAYTNRVTNILKRRAKRLNKEW